MLVVANLANTKWCKKPEKRLKPWQMGTHLRVLSESHIMIANTAGFRWFSKLRHKYPQHWKGLTLSMLILLSCKAQKLKKI